MPTHKNKANAIITPAGLGRRKVLAAAGGAAALPLIGRRARAAGEPIKIGWVGPLSPPGGYAEGTNMKNAAELAPTEINAQGGLLGRPVQFFYVDTRGMPAEGRTGAERLITENKVVAVFGEFHSTVALSEMEVVPQVRHTLHALRRVVRQDHGQGLSGGVPQRARPPR